MGLGALYGAHRRRGRALWAQTWAQAHLTATRRGHRYGPEPVFAALFAVGFGGERLTGRMLLGGLLVVAAMYLVELRPQTSPLVGALHHDV